jgi:hypothetical protein
MTTFRRMVGFSKCTHVYFGNILGLFNSLLPHYWGHTDVLEWADLCLLPKLTWTLTFSLTQLFVYDRWDVAVLCTPKEYNNCSVVSCMLMLENYSNPELARSASCLIYFLCTLDWAPPILDLVLFHTNGEGDVVYHMGLMTDRFLRLLVSLTLTDARLPIWCVSCRLLLWIISV